MSPPPQGTVSIISGDGGPVSSRDTAQNISSDGPSPAAPHEGCGTHGVDEQVRARGGDGGQTAGTQEDKYCWLGTAASSRCDEHIQWKGRDLGRTGRASPLQPPCPNCCHLPACPPRSPHLPPAPEAAGRALGWPTAQVTQEAVVAGFREQVRRCRDATWMFTHTGGWGGGTPQIPHPGHWSIPTVGTVASPTDNPRTGTSP